jgi:Ran GTPase-activating protein (RanGAP) involved in mRNA processing and transport
MEKEEPILLDQILLELGCFNKLPCRTHLSNICRLALKPRDPSATMVDANDSEKSGSTLSVGEVLTKLNNCKTLMLHNFEDSPLSDHQKANNGASISSSVKRLCLSKCSINEDTVSILENIDVEILIIWNCNFGSLPTALPSLKCLVVVDSYICKGAIERTLRSSGCLERVVLIRAGNMPNREKEESYYLSPDYYCAPSFHRHHRHIRHIRLCSLSQALLHSKITTLILERNIIPTPDLAYAIQNHLYLKKLSLNETIISDAFALWLAQALRKNTTLEELDLKQVRWSPIGAMTIADAIRSNTTLRCLDLSETMWHGPHSKEALRQTIRENSTLEHVQLNRLHDLPGEGSTILCYIFQALKVNETIASISLAGNYLHHQATRLLFQILEDHPSLVRMDLSKSSSPSGWGDALLGLAKNSTLRDVSLEYCGIGNQGALAIGKILASNHTLQSIDLCHNEIDSDGCYALVNGLKNSQSLKRIYLHGNSIDESCSMAIRDAMRDHNRSLQVIFLPSSHLQEELQYYGSINFAGRKYIGDLTLKHSISIWPLILERASQHPDMLLFLVKQNPDLFQRKVASRKRSLDDFLSK